MTRSDRLYSENSAMEACLLVDVGSAVPQLLPAQTSARDVLEKASAIS
jgi:hypothetical protein